MFDFNPGPFNIQIQIFLTDFCAVSCSTVGKNSLNIRSLSQGGTPLCDLSGDVRPDRVWFLGCFVLNGVSISSLSVLNRVSLHDLMA